MVKAEVWIVSLLFALGVIAGMTVLLVAQPGQTARSVPDPPSNASIATNQRPDASTLDPGIPWSDEDHHLGAARLIEEGDALLSRAHFSSAANRYREAQQLTGYVTSALSIRLGTCAELESQPNSAAEHYRRALETRPHPVERWLALAGLARAWLDLGKRSQALIVLCDLYLELKRTEQVPPELMAQVHYELALAVQNVALRDYHYDLSRPNGVVFHQQAPRIDILLKPLQQTDANRVFSPGDDRSERLLNTYDAELRPRITVLQRPTAALETTFVDIDTPTEPVSLLVHHLVSACDLPISVSPAAEAALRGRSKAVKARAMPAALLLDCLLIPLNIYWRQDDQGIHLVALDEPADEASSYWPGAMDRILRRFNLDFPGDFRNGTVLLSRANLKSINGDLDGAANHYQELMQLEPKEELLACLFFNQGKLELRLGRTEQAMRQFYLTVDQSHDPALQANAYWHVAQLALEANRLPESIKTAGRALALARNDSLRRQAAMTMARAYLLSNQPISANQVLFDHRHVLMGSPQELMAATLGSYSRYVSMTDAFHRKSESQRLLSALALLRDEHYTNFLDIYIAARAWQELGFRHETMEKLNWAALATSLPAWQRQFRYELANQLTQAQKWGQAEMILRELVESADDYWTDQSRLQIAQICLEQQRADECLSVCKTLMTRPLNESERQRVLNLMGHAHRLLGQHHSAALCFAGIVPEVMSRP